MSVAAELTKLKELLDKGVLTQEEYEKQKQIALNKSELLDSEVSSKQVEYKKDAGVIFRQEKSKLHNLGVWSIVFGFLSPLVAWIIGGIGISKATQIMIEFPNSKDIESEKSLCKIGIIIGIVVFVLGLIMGFFAFLQM